MDRATREFFGLVDGAERMIVWLDGRRARYTIDRVLLTNGNISGLRLTDQNDRQIAAPWSAIAHVELPAAARTFTR